MYMYMYLYKIIHFCVHNMQYRLHHPFWYHGAEGSGGWLFLVPPTKQEEGMCMSVHTVVWIGVVQGS